MYLSELFVLNHCGSKKKFRQQLRKQAIRVNDEIVDEDQLITDEKVTYKNQVLDAHPLHYVMFHKPAHVISANYDEDLCVGDFLTDRSLSITGRLDRDTTGLILLTNDLSLRKYLLNPHSQIEKVYQFTCEQPLNENDLYLFEKGIMIDGNVQTKPSHVHLSSPTQGEIILTEGKYHEIKKMFLSLNNRILSLHRIRFHTLELGDLPSGQLRELSVSEIQDLGGKI